VKSNILNGTGLLVLAASLWLLPQGVDAQIRFGAAIGLNYTDIDDVDFGSTTAVYDSRQGYHIGVFADIPVGPLGVRPGVFYMNAGKIFENGLGDFIDEVVDDPDLQFDDDFEVEYITIPIDVRYRFGFGPVLPYLFLGPELRFRTETNLIEEVDDNLKSFGVAGNLGAGVEVSLLSVKLLPEFRLAFDTSGIIDDEITIGDFEFVADEAHQLRTVMLRLGVIF